MKKKINLSLVIIEVAAIIATVIGITILYYGLFQKQVRSDLYTSAEILKETHYFEQPDIKVNDMEFSDEIRQLRVTWIDQDGTVLYDNDAKAGELTNHMDRPEIKDAFATGRGESVRKSDTMNKNTFYCALLLENGTVLRVATDAQSIWSVFISAAPMTLFLILCIIGVCALISHFLTRQLVRPIETMAENLEDADYETPYKELDPFARMIRSQHTEILSAAKARQDFTANVSHELKTPLTAISGYAELLESNMVVEDKKRHFYQEIRKNADRLLALINDIIRLSELDRSERQPGFEDVDLFETVSE